MLLVRHIEVFQQTELWKMAVNPDKCLSAPDPESYDRLNPSVERTIITGKRCIAVLWHSYNPYMVGVRRLLAEYVGSDTEYSVEPSLGPSVGK